MINRIQEINLILAEPENYKGIVYVRLSALPYEQNLKIRESCPRESIFKILKEDSQMNDCMIYTDYVKWYNQNNLPAVTYTRQESLIHPGFLPNELINHS